MPPCLNIGGPPSKPKYEFTTDSVLVLRRKDEKEVFVAVKRI
jgi:hypothetical protein